MSQYLASVETDMERPPQSLQEWRDYLARAMGLKDHHVQTFFDAMVEAGLTDNLVTAATTPGVSIVVLPFENRSGDPEQDYFSDGITEGIILSLARFPLLEVKSRHASFAVKEQNMDLGRIGDEFDLHPGRLQRFFERGGQTPIGRNQYFHNLVP